MTILTRLALLAAAFVGLLWLTTGALGVALATAGLACGLAYLVRFYFETKNGSQR